jgi:TolA-binding protein
MKNLMKPTLAVILLLSLGFVSCRPRASRTANRTAKPATPATATQSGTSAKQVLARTDSAIQRVGSMMTGDADLPPLAAEPMPGFGMPPFTAPYVPRPNMAEYNRFEAGLGAFNGARYDEAIGHFSQVVLSGRPPEMVPNAYYWMGESYYAMQRYAESLPYFEYTTNVGPQYRKETAFYKLGRANLALGNRQAARLWYERLRVEFPRSSYVSRLKKALG